METKQMKQKKQIENETGEAEVSCLDRASFESWWFCFAG